MGSRNIKELCRTLVGRVNDFIILGMLDGKKLSGYDVIGAFNKRFRVLMSSGTVYSTLYALERQGLVKGAWVKRRRVYTLTVKGEETVNEIRSSPEPVVVIVKPLIFRGNREEANG